LIHDPPCSLALGAISSSSQIPNLLDPRWAACVMKTLVIVLIAAIVLAAKDFGGCFV
jgi:hypothetical protein